MKRILFINPSHRSDVLEEVKILSLPPVSLATLASHTPERYKMRLLDEAVD